VVEPFDYNGRGRIAINGTEYTVEQRFDFGEEAFALCSYRLTKADGTTYDLDAGNGLGCSCADHTWHPERQGGCKHMAAPAVPPGS
jgi:hypothetical protein